MNEKTIIGNTEDERCLLTERAHIHLHNAKKEEKKFVKAKRLTRVNITNGYIMTTCPEKWRDVNGNCIRADK